MQEVSTKRDFALHPPPLAALAALRAELSVPLRQEQVKARASSCTGGCTRAAGAHGCKVGRSSCHLCLHKLPPVLA